MHSPSFIYSVLCYFKFLQDSNLPDIPVNLLLQDAYNVPYMYFYADSVIGLMVVESGHK